LRDVVLEETHRLLPLALVVLGLVLVKALDDLGRNVVNCPPREEQPILAVICRDLDRVEPLSSVTVEGTAAPFVEGYLEAGLV
jgi:hypothetical protein